MPPLEKANTFVPAMWVHLLTTHSQLSLTTTVKVTEATVPCRSSRRAANLLGPGRGRYWAGPFTLLTSHKQIWNVSPRKWIFTELTGANCTSLRNARQCHAAILVPGFAILVNTKYFYWYTRLESASDSTPCLQLFSSPILSQFKMLIMKSKTSN